MNRSARPGGDRLAKYLAHAGVAARRVAEQEYIARGRVRINGQPATDPAVRVALGDLVEVDGVAVRPEAPVVFAVHKPAGVLSAARDARGRTTVVDLLGPQGVRLYPVGRLDTDSEGLLLVTNDGALAHLLLHPRHGVPRTYAALVRPRPDATALWRLEAGVRLSDGAARADEAEILSRAPRGVAEPATPPATGWLRVVLRQGRNRQVRRMCAAVGLDVLRLVRVAFGGLHLQGIAPGGWRRLTAAQVAELRALAGGSVRVPGRGRGGSDWDR